MNDNYSLTNSSRLLFLYFYFFLLDLPKTSFFSDPLDVLLKRVAFSHSFFHKLFYFLFIEQNSFSGPELLIRNFFVLFPYFWLWIGVNDDVLEVEKLAKRRSKFKEEKNKVKYYLKVLVFLMLLFPYSSLSRFSPLSSLWAFRSKSQSP